MVTAALVVLGLITAILSVLFVGLLRSHAQVLRALHELGVGADDAGELKLGSAPVRRSATAQPTETSTLGPAVDITGVTPTGDATRVAVAGVQHVTLLAFLSTGCGVCAEFWDKLPGELRGERRDGAAPRIVVVTQGVEAESPGGVASLTPPGATVVMSSDAWEAYGVRGAPYFALVDGPSSRIVGEGTASSWDRVRTLLGRVDEDRATEARTRRELFAGTRRPRSDRETEASS